jgi:hypothetical protein
MLEEDQVRGKKMVMKVIGLMMLQMWGLALQL